jgi:hypothetical protein
MFSFMCQGTSQIGFANPVRTDDQQIVGLFDSLTGSQLHHYRFVQTPWMAEDENPPFLLNSFK